MSPIKKSQEISDDASSFEESAPPIVPENTRSSYDSSSLYQGRGDDKASEVVAGILDIKPEGLGFLRQKFRLSEKDIYISSSQIRRFWLRNGDLVEGMGRPPKDNERYYGLLKIEKINGKVATEGTKRVYFEDLTPIYPDRHLILSTKKLPLSTRLIDLV